MAYSTLHVAATARGLGDGSTYNNAAEAFPGGNWLSQALVNDYSAAGLVLLFQNTAPYTLSQAGSTAIFSSTVPGVNTYGLTCLSADSNGNVVSPSDLGWKCSQGNLDTTGFAAITYSLTSAMVAATKIAFRCFDITSPSQTGSLFATPYGIIDWCNISCTTNGTGTALIAVSLASNSAGITNSQVNQSGGYARMVSGTSAGLILNVRVIGDPASTTGTRYGIAYSTNSPVPPVNGPVFVKDCPGVGIINFNTGSNAGWQLSRATVVDCGTGIATLNGTSGGNGLLLVTDSVITGCTYGLSQPYGRYDLRNVVLRNSTDFQYAAGTPVFDPLSIVTAETDSQLYTDHASGDYRIKTTSAHWGKNRGAQDAPATGGGITQARLNHVKNMMRHGVSI